MVSSEIRIGDLVADGSADVKTGPFGTQLKAAEYVSSGTPVINVRNIGFGTIRKQKLEFIDGDTTARLFKHLLKPRDIVFGRKGAVERHCFIRKEQAGWLQGSDCIRLRLKDESKLNSHYLSYCFLTHEHKQWMIAHCSHGATMASLNQDIIYRIPIKLISLEEQEKIVSILKSYDNLIENNHHRIAILEDMAQSLYREWFVKFRFPGHQNTKFKESSLGLIPEEWEVVNLGELIDVRKGKNITRKTIVNGVVPVVAGGLTPAYYHNQANTKHPVITVSASGANSGFVKIYEEDVWASDCSYVDNNTTPYVYYYYSLLKDRQVEITRMQRGAAQPHVYPIDLMRLEVLRVQEVLLDKFNVETSPIFKMMKNINKRNINLKNQRDMLLPKLISGKISLNE